MPYRFPRSLRLLTAADYTAVLKGADVNLAHGPLRLRAIQNRMPNPRLGVVVSKKGTPKAVRRNRIKRIVREQFRQRQHQLPGVDLVIQVFGRIEDEQLLRLLNEQFAALERAFPAGES